LEDAVTVLEGEQKDMFLRFVRSMLRWLPEERAGAGKLVRDPWMVGEDGGG
jgi:hypothetical protein